MLIAAVILLMLPDPLHAAFAEDWARMQPITPKAYLCVRANSPVKIDGRLDEAAWQSAPWTDEFVDIEGAARPKPRFRTRARMLWDDQFFYVAAELDEPHVWGTLTNHDAVIFHDNDFEVFIDPNADNHEYYEFEINALNTGWDLFLRIPYKDGGSASNAWEIPGLKTAVHVRGTLNHPADTDAGWNVELAFPWAVLGEFAHGPAPPRDGDHWRVNFSRVEWKIEIGDGKYRKVANTKEDNWVWSPQGIIDMHRPERWGRVQFVTAPPGKAKLRSDSTLPARDLLHHVYYAQRDFHERQKRWASSLEELGPDRLKLPRSVRSLTVTAVPGGFEATAKLGRTRGAPQTIHIRQDSRIWME